VRRKAYNCTAYSDPPGKGSLLKSVLKTILFGALRRFEGPPQVLRLPVRGAPIFLLASQPVPIKVLTENLPIECHKREIGPKKTWIGIG
jgi:hypothetical protein